MARTSLRVFVCVVYESYNLLNPNMSSIEDTMENVFHDFPELPCELLKENLHKKRLVIEDRIYSILKSKYMLKLKEFWSTYTVPRQSDRCIVIVERRIHPNLEFILYNAAYFARGWSIAIVCSDVNVDYIKGILGHNLEQVHLIQMFKGNPNPDVGKNEYNYLLQESRFYSALPSENLLMMEMDTYLRKPIPDTIFQYDYVAAPYAWDETMSGGGLSFRKRSKMLEICSTYRYRESAQDVYASKGMNMIGASVPSFEESLEYFCESCLYEDPIGLHQWWTFFSLNIQEDDYVYMQYMTLEMLD